MPQVSQSKESAENFSITNEGSGSASSHVGTLSGNGGPKGKYRIAATAANWNGGSTSLQSFPGGTVYASFSQGNSGHVDVALPQGTYIWTHTGKPQGVQASVRAI